MRKYLLGALVVAGVLTLTGLRLVSQPDSLQPVTRLTYAETKSTVASCHGTGCPQPGSPESVFAAKICQRFDELAPARQDQLRQLVDYVPRQMISSDADYVYRDSGLVINTATCRFGFDLDPVERVYYDRPPTDLDCQPALEGRFSCPPEPRWTG